MRQYAAHRSTGRAHLARTRLDRARTTPHRDPRRDAPGRFLQTPRSMTMLTNTDRYRDLIERFSDCVMLLDPSGRCVYVNAAAEQALGQRLPELRARVLWDAIPAPLSLA